MNDGSEGELRRSLPYAAALLVLFAAVALLRHDLLVRCLELAWRQLHRGWPARLQILGETVLFLSCLGLALRVIPTRAEPLRDAAVFVATFALGWLAEAWGTRVGLWSYYTHEAPPLWIIPAWSLGALVIDRVSARAEEGWGKAFGPRAARAGYWALAALFLAVFLAFSRPAWGRPSTWLVLAAYAAALAVKPRPERDFWILAAGAVYVFFADFWGTTNGCWRYYLMTGGLPRLFAGVSFGMLFDSGLLLMGLRLGRLLVPPRR